MNAACECTVLCAIVWVCEAHLGHGIITHLCESDPGSQIHNSLTHTKHAEAQDMELVPICHSSFHSPLGSYFSTEFLLSPTNAE